MIPSTRSARASRSTAGSSSLETTARLSAYSKPGADAFAVDRDHEELPLAGGAEEPQLRGAGA